MSMYINTNVAAINAHRNLGANNTTMGKTMEKLSSGYRINRAADDAAGLAISEKMRFQINGLNQAQRNAQDGISLLQTAEGALTEVHAMLQRMNTLANQSANGTYATEDRAALQAEVSQLLAEIDNIAKSTKFNGINLLNAASGATVSFQVGVEATNKISVALANMTSTGLGINAVNISTQTGATSALAIINSAITKVSSQRGNFGAVQNRLEHTINNLGVTAENLAASESRIRNADMAKEMTEFTRNQILVQAGTAMLAQANAMPQGVLKLLG
ncbi:flagellin [Paenibacillus sp. 32O-W]|uniref:flagellin N-terminal helical domain-containing protein n=1 Tax=Paenibacillus sp. 32O-W TaxID=1695218 RepID=UPI00071EB2D2|nr:flagellin [Paenibacillus sp. 32O-W]ALS26095.1 flagellin [Paenibacillus sp. 32O-W]